MNDLKNNTLKTDVSNNSEACPIYTGAVQGKEIILKGHKKQYCEAGEVGWIK